MLQFLRQPFRNVGGRAAHVAADHELGPVDHELLQPQRLWIVAVHERLGEQTARSFGGVERGFTLLRRIFLQCGLRRRLLGFVLPLVSAIAHSANVWDCLIWVAIALIVQITVYFLVRVPVPNLSARIAAGDEDKIPSLMSDRWLSEVTLYGSPAQVREGLESMRAVKAYGRQDLVGAEARAGGECQRRSLYFSPSTMKRSERRRA